MDLDVNAPTSKIKESNVLGAGDVNFKADDHSPAEVQTLFPDESKGKSSRKASDSTEDFEHVDHEPLINFGKSAQEQAKKTDSDNFMDDFIGSVKTQYESAKTDFGKEFSQLGTSAKDVGAGLLSGIETKLGEKISQTKDFMAAERGAIETPKYPEPQSKPETKPLGSEKFDDFDNEPFSSSPVKSLIKEDNEKFISSEDLLGDFKDDRTKTPEPVLQAQLKKADPILKGSLPQHVTEPQEKFISSEDLLGDFKVEQVQKNLGPAAPLQPHQPEPPKEKQEVPKKAPQKPEPAAVSPASQVTKTTVAPSSPKPMISAEEMFCRYGLVESLIYWRDVKKSGIVFGVGIVVLLAISCFSVISVFAYLSLLALSGTIAFRIYKTVLGAVQKTSEGHPFKEYLEPDLALSQDKVQQIVNVAVAHINGFVSELRRLFLVEDLVDSLKFGVILWILTYIGAWFNGMTLVILAFVALFTLPKVYENNKQSIDMYLDLVRSKFLEITDKVKAAVPIGKKPETDKDK